MIRIILILLAAALALVGRAPGPARAEGRVLQLAIDDPIGPATAEFVGEGLAHAARRNADAVILTLDTPGGLESSMREIIRAMLQSPVPIIAFVSPAGARAASAGTYIVYASNLAATAPSTHLGAATPVALGLLFGGGAGDEKGKERPGAEAAKGSMTRRPISPVSPNCAAATPPGPRRRCVTPPL